MRFDPKRGTFDTEATAALKAAGLNTAGLVRLRDGARVYTAVKRSGRVPKAERDRYVALADAKTHLAGLLRDEQRRGFDWPTPLLAALEGEREVDMRLDAWNRVTRLRRSRSDPDLLNLHTATLDAWRIAGHDLKVSARKPGARRHKVEDDGGPSVRFLQLAVRLIAGNERVPTVSGAKAIIRRAREHITVAINRRADGLVDVDVVVPRHVISRLLKKNLK
jgi:hypothetical protein